MKYFFLFIVLIVIYISSIQARVDITSYKNGDLNICDISMDLSNTGLRTLTVNFISANCVKTLMLQNNSITDLQENIFDKQPYLEYLDLSRNQLNVKKFFTFGGNLSLKVLILDHNNNNNNNNSDHDSAKLIEKSLMNHTNSDSDVKLENLQEEYMRLNISYSYPELKYLSLRNIHVSGFSEDLISHFPKLEHLDLSENKFTEDTLNFLLKNVSSSIKSLILENVGLNIVRTESLNDIEQLNLNHNHLPRLSSHKCHGNTLCLESMDNLKILSLSNCSIKYIEENAFKNMKNLLELDFSNNHLQHIPSKVFYYLSSLNSLDLSRNPLFTMPTIGNLENLTTLFMDEMKDENLLSSLKEFPHLPQLEYLSIQGNKLTFISPTLFQNLPMLRKLNLSNNHMTQLPSWDTQSSLHELNLSSNRFETLDNLSLKNAKSLKVLDLRNNSISEIRIDSFRDLLSKELTLHL